MSAPVALTEQHDLSAFDCGQPALNDWLRSRALKSEGRFARTYVLCTDTHVIGYFCIAVGSVERIAVPGKVRRNAPDPVPVSILGRLAVDKRHAGKGLGADLLSDAFRRILSASRQVGISAVLVHAKDDAARAFYMACAEFLEYPAESRTLFLPIDTIEAACG